MAEMDAAKLTITLADKPKPLPAPETLLFGQTMTDHMLIMSYSPTKGWSSPKIQPYGSLSLDPASSCLHYCTSVFDGMKTYLGPNGEPRLFRPDMNMQRLVKSAERLALPTPNPSELLALIKRLIAIDLRWVPQITGYSLYIRPTIIGTQPSLNVNASNEALLYVILSPTGPYFPTGPKPITLLAVYESVRAWPGGTGGNKVGLNYAPGLLPQQIAAKQGYQQILWLLGDKKIVTEAGAMNFFVVKKRPNGDYDLITPALDGTILPGITRASCLSLAASHSVETCLPGIPESVRIHPDEQTITIYDLFKWSEEGSFVEALGVGTAVIVAPIGRIGFEGKDIFLPEYEGGLGPVGKALRERLADIQEGRFEWKGWGVPL